MRKTTVDVIVYWFLYCRVSEEKRHDIHDPGESTPGQERHLRDLAESRGGTVLAVITEAKPISASEYTIKERPGYKRLLDTMESEIRRIRTTQPNAKFVLAAREDTRISRRPVEREELMELCRRLGVKFNWAGAEYDPENPDHRLTFRITGATAAHTSDMTAYKVKSKVAQRVKEHRPHGKMPSIYRRHCDERTGKNLYWELDPIPAKATKEAIEAILDGRSGIEGHSVMAAWEHYRKKTGHDINRTVFRRMILKPALAGILMHKGEVIGKGNWPALITEDQHERLVAILTADDRDVRPVRGTAPVYLLSNIPKCGVPDCPGAEIYPGWRYIPGWRENGIERPRVYRCLGCNKLQVIAKPVEMLAEKAIKKLLTHPRILDELNRSDVDDSGSAILEIRRELATLTARMDGFYLQAARGALSDRGLTKLEAELLPEISELKDRLAAMAPPASATGRQLLAHYAGPDAAKLWDKEWPIELKRALVRAGLDITILPAVPGSPRRFNPDRIDIRWRVPA